MSAAAWGDLTAALGREPDLASRADVWASLHVLTGAVPAVEVVTETLRRAEFDGASALLEAAAQAPPVEASAVEVLRRPTLVEVGGDGGRLADRLVAEAVPRWRDHGIVEVRWRADGAGLVRAGDDDDAGQLLVPLGGRYLGVGQDLAPSVQRPLLSLVHSAGLATSFVGYDCIPVTDAETVPEDRASAFANRLAALRHADRVVAVSEASAVEFRGWRRMLGGAGLSGPDVVVVRPADVETDAPAAVSPLRHQVWLAGDDEARDNRAAAAAAVDRLRREGLDVTVVDEFADAAFVVATPLHDGYALDVADALALGTPVVTSSYGSAAEIAAGGGALLVDPRDDDAITDAVRRLLTDDDLLARLRAEALARPRRTWDVYAAQAWRALTGVETQPRSTDTAAP